MLRPKTLANILSQGNTGGVECSLLLNREGALLAYSGLAEKDKPKTSSASWDPRMTAVLASSIWHNYERYGKIAFNEDKLRCTLVKCQHGSLVIAQVASVLLCLQANKDVPLGLLQTKAKTLAEYLEEPLTQVSLS